MNAIVSFRKCTLSNGELLKEVDSQTDKMYSEYGRIPDRQIPARPNKDYDMVVGELIMRFVELEKLQNECKCEEVLLVRHALKCRKCGKLMEHKL